MSLFFRSLRGLSNFLAQGRLHGEKSFLGLIGRGGMSGPLGVFFEGSWNAPMEEGGSFFNILLSITKLYRNVQRLLRGHQHVCQSMFCGTCRSKDP